MTDSFDLRLFVLKCIQRIRLVLLGILVGSLLVGGIYYIRNVVMAGAIPYKQINKYYLTYEVDPSDQLTYSYFAGFTWTDFLQSDDSLERIQKVLAAKGYGGKKTDAEIRSAYKASLESDLRILYITVTDPDKAYVGILSEAVAEEMALFPQEHREIAETSLMTLGECVLAKPDVRTFRAFVLGAVIGGFLSLFVVGLLLLIGEENDLPLQLQQRFGYPVFGYQDQKGNFSPAAVSMLQEYMLTKQKITVYSVEKAGELKNLEEGLKNLEKDAKKAEKIDDNDITWQFVENFLQVSSNLPVESDYTESNSKQQGVVIAVKAGKTNSGAVREMLRILQQKEVKVDALLLTSANERLIKTYMFGRK